MTLLLNFLPLRRLTFSLTASLLSTGVLGALLVGLSGFEAKAKSYGPHGGDDTIRVESRLSANDYVIVPVRPSRRGGGHEVRLPTGSWVHCEGNCRWTVQKKYLDFWEYQRSPFGPGYLRLRGGF